MELHPELRLILSILTCYRLALLVSEDDGPFFIFKRVRYWLKDKAFYEMMDNKLEYNEANKDRWFGKWHNLAEGLSCPYCTGVWSSLPLILLNIKPTTLGDLFLILMSISGGQAFLQSLKR